MPLQVAGMESIKMRRIRKRYRVTLLAAIVAALSVPVGYALSSDSAPLHARSESAAHQPVQVPAVPDAAKLLIVGTSLFGLAAAVRKAR